MCLSVNRVFILVLLEFLCASHFVFFSFFFFLQSCGKLIVFINLLYIYEKNIIYMKSRHLCRSVAYNQHGARSFGKDLENTGGVTDVVVVNQKDTGTSTSGRE